METEQKPRPWYRRGRFQLVIIVIVVLLVVSLYPYLVRAPVSPNQVRLNLAVDYFVNNYDFTVGLVPETPASHNYWLYSDNYLVILAISRYDPGNQSTNTFASALKAAFYGYVATMPAALADNQYLALNETSGYFDCSSTHLLTWTNSGGNRSAVLMTTTNDKDPKCGLQNYADLILLQALYQHRLGNSAAAATLYGSADSDFDGYGLKDLAYTNQSSSSYHVYQTYKLALYVYATYCLGEQQQSALNLAKATVLLRFLQSNSTGGFNTGYTPNSLGVGPAITATGGVNTETTALAMLALEQAKSSSTSC